MSECWTSCPKCDAEIEFYTVVDETGQCPECGTGRNTLFSIAQTDTASEQAIVADGGADNA